MKKWLALILLMTLMLTSCEKNMLDVAAFDEDFRAEDPSMFYASNHEHDLRYEYILERNDPTLNKGISIYHRVYCYYENCDFESYLEPHTVKVLNTGNAYLDTPQVLTSTYSRCKENGYQYHLIRMECSKCHVRGENTYFHIWALCETQAEKCTGTCLENINWEEYICDMPYEISYE